MLCIYALIFVWMDMISFLKENGINKKHIIIYIDFQVTISKWCIVHAIQNLSSQLISEIRSNLAHEFSSEHFWVFHFFMRLVLVLFFQEALGSIVDKKIYYDHVKILKLENYETCSMLNVLIINNSQMTLLLGHFIIILQTKLIISCVWRNKH